MKSILNHSYNSLICGNIEGQNCMLGFGSGVISLDISNMNILAKASVEREVRAIAFLQNNMSDKKFILIG